VKTCIETASAGVAARTPPGRRRAGDGFGPGVTIAVVNVRFTKAIVLLGFCLGAVERELHDGLNGFTV
jgi:hypothetical protein